MMSELGGVFDGVRKEVAVVDSRLVEVFGSQVQDSDLFVGYNLTQLTFARNRAYV